MKAFLPQTVFFKLVIAPGSKAGVNFISIKQSQMCRFSVYALGERKCLERAGFSTSLSDCSDHLTMALSLGKDE